MVLLVVTTTEDGQMHQETRDTYNHSSGSLSDHYDRIGPRSGDIDLAFSLAGNPTSARVLELGCGNGRDARAILRKTSSYIGIDTSEQMIERAHSKVPQGQFEVADAVTYNFPGHFDIIFSFALLRHLSIPELTSVLKRAAHSLNEGGVLYLSSNYNDIYLQESRSDDYGTREMFYYNPAIIQKYAPRSLTKIQEIYDTIDGAEWFEVALRKQSHA